MANDPDVKSGLKPETLAAQAMGRMGGEVDAETKSVTPPIHVSTTYLREPDLSYPDGRIYSRADNPTYVHAERLLGALEEGVDAMVLASGMAAATAVFLALKPGDHVVAPKVMYWSLRNWLNTRAREWGIEVDFVEMSDLESLRAAVRPDQTQIVWIETPANPMWSITDIAAAADIAHQAGAKLVVDSTVATPVLCRPITLGADIVMHSATKYLNGHSDVIAGALITAKDDALWQRIKANRAQIGAVLGPFEAAQLLRGMRTLYLRVPRACESALFIAEALDRHPAISQVLYPGLAGFPGHDLAAGQMRGGFGGMLSIRFVGGRDHAVATAGRVKLWFAATSLGGVDSLIEHRASIEGDASPVPDDLLRLSVGIENAEDLLNDLLQAMES